MNNLKKVGLTALAGALVSVSANAAEMSVTGGASISFAGEEKQTTGNGWSTVDGLTFSATVDQDWGSITAKQIIDSSDGAAGAIMDTRILTMDIIDVGTLTFAGTGGSSVLNAIDDVTPNAGEESWADVTGAGVIPGGTGGDNMFHFSTSEFMDGDVTLSASYTPSNAATVIESSADYGIKYTGIDGLTLGAAQGENNAAAASLDINNVYATYTFDSFSVGFQQSESDSETANADIAFTAFGLSYTVNKDMAISLNTSEVSYENSSYSDQEATGISVSYTMGSMTLKANTNSVENIAGTATDDRSGYALSLGFTF